MRCSSHPTWPLHNQFSQSNWPRIFQLRKDLSTLTQGNHYVNTYYSQLKGFWDEFSTLKPTLVCGCKPISSSTSMKLCREEQVEESAMHFLMVLNDSYSQIRGKILLMEAFIPLAKYFLLHYKRQDKEELHLTCKLLIDLLLW